MLLWGHILLVYLYIAKIKKMCFISLFFCFFIVFARQCRDTENYKIIERGLEAWKGP